MLEVVADFIFLKMAATVSPVLMLLPLLHQEVDADSPSLGPFGLEALTHRM